MNDATTDPLPPPGPDPREAFIRAVMQLEDRPCPAQADALLACVDALPASTDPEQACSLEPLLAWWRHTVRQVGSGAHSLTAPLMECLLAAGDVFCDPAGTEQVWTELLQRGVAALEQSPPVAPPPPLWPEPARGLNVANLAQFAEEAADRIQEVENALLELDLAPSEEAVHRAFRSAHSLKGIAGALGLTQLTALSSRIEDMLGAVRAGRRAIDRAASELLFRGIDYLRSMVAGLGAAGEKPHALAEYDAALRQWCDLPAASPSGVAFVGAPPEEGPPTLGHARPIRFVEVLPYLHRVAQGDCTVATLNGLGGTIRGILAEVEADSPSSAVFTQLLETVERIAEARDRFQAMLPPLPAPASGPLPVAASSPTPSRPLPAPVSAAEPTPSRKIFLTGSRPLGSKSVIIERAAPAPAAHAEAEKRPTPASAPAPTPAAPAAPAAAAAAAGRASVSAIRVDSRKLDEYMNLARELVIARNALAHSFRERVAERGSMRALKDSIDKVDRIVGDLQTNSMAMRMVPVGTVFQKFPRLVRDIARSLRKEIELHIEGEETELDRQVAEALSDPLVHLVRNSADHGLEATDHRVAAGKPRAGRVTLRAAREGKSILIEVRDDGAGINVERVKEKAVRAGILDAARAAAMSDREAWELIFAPGLSTAQEVSDLSGRGVGMDVVRNNIHALGGTVEVDSSPGMGTSIRLLLPLTLAVARVVLIRSGGEAFGIPIDAVQETVKLQRSEFRSLMGTQAVSLRGEVIPVCGLHEVLHGVPAAEPERSTRRDDRQPVVILTLGKTKFGIRVDELLGQQEIVLKPMPRNVGSSGAVGGATIMGDGSVILILDTAGLNRQISGHAAGASLSRA